MNTETPQGFPEATKQAILAADDFVMEPVDVPEWKLRVFVCGLTGTGKDEYEKSIVEFKGKKTTLNMSFMRTKLLVRTVVDKNRGLLFTETDIEKLGTKSALALDRLYEVARRLSGLDDKEVETIAKNSGAGQASDSANASPSLQG